MGAKNFISKLAPLVSGIFILLVIFFVAGAFTSPTQNPPGGNVAQPLHTGSSPQTKSGDLTVANLTVTNLLQTLGNLVVNGTANISGWAHSNVVAGLNADRVDSYHSADLLAQAAQGGRMLTMWGVISTTVIPNPSDSAPSCPAGWTGVYAGYGPFLGPVSGTTSAVGGAALDICSTSETLYYTKSDGYGASISAKGVFVSAYGGVLGYNLCRVCVQQ